MKIKIEVDEELKEDEVIIRCSRLDESILQIQQALSDIASITQRLVLHRGDMEYYLPQESILFFETDKNGICVHTVDNVYQTNYKLYELEDLLPGYFMRVSKSAILNTRQVFAIDRNLSASSLVQFQGTHKQIYVSRYYYKALKHKLEEKRMSR